MVAFPCHILHPLSIHRLSCPILTAIPWINTFCLYSRFFIPLMSKETDSPHWGFCLGTASRQPKPCSSLLVGSGFGSGPFFVLLHLISLWDAVSASFCPMIAHKPMPSLSYNPGETLGQGNAKLLKLDGRCSGTCNSSLESSMPRPKGEYVGVKSCGFPSQVNVIQQSWWHF